MSSLSISISGKTNLSYYQYCQNHYLKGQDDEIQKFQERCYHNIENPEPGESSNGLAALIATVTKISTLYATIKSKIEDVSYDKEVIPSLVIDSLFKLPIRLLNGLVTVTTSLKNYFHIGGSVIAATTTLLFLKINCVAAAVFSSIELGIHSYRLGKQIQFGNQFDFKLIDKMSRAIQADEKTRKKLSPQIIKNVKKIKCGPLRDQLLNIKEWLEDLEKKPTDTTALSKLRQWIVNKNVIMLRQKYFSVSHKCKHPEKGFIKIQREFAKRVGVNTAKSLENVDIKTISLENSLALMQTLKSQHEKYRQIHMIAIVSAILTLTATALFLFPLAPISIPIIISVISLICYATYLYRRGSLEKVGKTTVLENLKNGAKHAAQPIAGITNTTLEKGTQLKKRIKKVFQKMHNPNVYHQERKISEIEKEDPQLLQFLG